MTRPELVSKKLAEIETFLAELRRHGKPDEIEENIVQQRFIEHTLQIMIQAMLDIASHIVSDDRLGEPTSNRELFDLLEHSGWLTPELRRRILGIVGFRNVVVHSYDQVDLAVVRRVMADHLEDVDQFIAEIRERMAAA